MITSTRRAANGTVAAALATPTDLTPEAVSAISATLNTLIADTFALYLKTKNFHWHLSGRHFRDYHLMFDEQAADIILPLDELAERVRKIGGLTLHSVGEISTLQTLSDDNDTNVPANEMVARLLADNRHVAEAQRRAIELCDAHRDAATASILEVILDNTERRIWFLFETLRDSAEA